MTCASASCRRRIATTSQRLRDAGFLGKELMPSRRDDPLLLTPLFTDRDGTVYTIMVSPPIWSNLLFAPDVRIVLLASALLLSGLVCWLLARYLSKPVERLQSSARSLAAGNMEARVGQEFSRRRDELGVLARDFDTMADHVRNLIASKENLLRAMSHELRSPLARLRVATDLARRPERRRLASARSHRAGSGAPRYADRADPAAVASARGADVAARAARSDEPDERDHRGRAAGGGRGREVASTGHRPAKR